MITFKKTITLASAVSIAALSAAHAGDDIFAGEGLLEINEAPLTTDELKKARGGFKVGGLIFNIGVVVHPPTSSPLPDNGLFGDKGGPIGKDGVFGSGGVFGDGGGPNGQQKQNAAPPSNQTPVNNPAQGGPSMQPSASQSNTPSGDSAGAAPSNPPATGFASSPPAAATAPQQPTAANTTPAANPNAAPVATLTATAANSSASNSALTQTTSTTTSPGGPVSSAPNGQNAKTSPAETPAGGSAPTQTANNSTMTGGSASAQQSSSGASNAGDPGTNTNGANADLSFSLGEVSSPKVIRQIGPEGILTVLNNTLDNQKITTRVDVTVDVPNFAHQMSLTKAANTATQAFNQQVFLGGLTR